MIHSRDVEAAMDLCKETLLEVDMTSFVQNICGHIKDFKMKSGIEMLRQQRYTADETQSLFPLSLLRLHQPCTNLKHAHQLIQKRFQEILCLSFRPVPSQRDYYFYYQPLSQLTPSPVADEIEPCNVSIGLFDREVINKIFLFLFQRFNFQL